MVAAAAAERSWVRGGLLGAGSFASVSLAVDSDTGELFAVKSAECGGGGGRIQALENELRILSSITSPRVVKCLGSAWSTSSKTGEPISRDIFLEYMPGGSVADLMSKLGGRIHERLARVYTRGIVEGLEFLHSRGIVHCDIKGKNVLVGASGGIKLADFGAARVISDSSAFNGESSEFASIRGTPLWMAPEVVRQEQQGAAADVWSLGCTVLEMVSGRAPWSEVSDPFVALYRIGCSDELPSLPAASIMSEQGRDFVSKCLERDPSKRWTCSQLLRHPFVTEPFVDEEHEQQRHHHQQQPPSLVIPAFDRAEATSSPVFDGKWIVVKSPVGKSSSDSDSPFNNLSDFDTVPESEVSSSKDDPEIDRPSSSSSSSGFVFSDASSSWAESARSVTDTAARASHSDAPAAASCPDEDEASASRGIAALFLGETDRNSGNLHSQWEYDRDPRRMRCDGEQFDRGRWIKLRWKSNWIHLRHRLLWRLLVRRCSNILRVLT